MDRLKDKVVIVTGSTSGIGIGIAKLCAKEAAQVVITGRNVERGQKVVDEIAAEITKGLEIIPVNHMDEVLRIALVQEEREHED